MDEQVDDFLAHYGIKGMRWGRRSVNSDTPKQLMSRKKKVAIAVGVGATLAIGAAITVSILNDKKKMNTSVTTIVNKPSTSKGKSAVQNSDTYLLDSYRNDMVERARKTQPLPNKADLDNYRKEAIRKATTPTNANKPSLDILSEIMNGGPTVVYNSKSGRYETR